MPRDIFGPRSAGSKQYRPLQFEPDLLGGSPRRSLRRRSGRSLRRLGAALAAGAILLGLWGWARYTSDDRALAEMASTVFQAVHDGSVKSGSADPGFLGWILGNATALAQPHETTILALDSSILERIRADLNAAGVKWQNTRPLAFGGVRARVTDPVLGPWDVTAVTGNVYFAAGDKVYALEVSAQREGNQYIATDIWQCVPLDASAEDIEALESHAQAGYQDFVSEKPHAGDEAAPIIDQAESVFLVL